MKKSFFRKLTPEEEKERDERFEKLLKEYPYNDLFRSEILEKLEELGVKVLESWDTLSGFYTFYGEAIVELPNGLHVHLWMDGPDSEGGHHSMKLVKQKVTYDENFYKQPYNGIYHGEKIIENIKELMKLENKDEIS